MFMIKTDPVCTHRLKKTPLKFCVMALLSFPLVSCGALESGEKDEQISVKTSVETKKPEEERQSLTLPPGVREGGTSSQSGDNNPGGLESLKGLKGINIESLFSEKLRDDEARFERLENAFLDLHRQFKTLEPAIIRLVAIEEDMRNLTDLLSENLEVTEVSTGSSSNTLLEGDMTLEPQKAEAVQQEVLKVEGVKSPPLQASSVKPTPPQNVSTSSPAANAQKTLSDIRVGHHPEFTRVVIDARQDIAYQAAFDDAHQKFTIRASDAAWTGQARRDYPGHPLLDYYTVEAMKDGSGSIIHLNFKMPVTLSHEEALKQSVQPVLRIVFDFRKL